VHDRRADEGEDQPGQAGGPPAEWR
jgi:hypothetical protein